MQKSADEATSILRIALFCSLISGLIYSQISGVIVTAMGQTMLALILGIMIILQIQGNQPDSVDASATHSSSLSIMIVSGIILVSLAYLVTPPLTTRIFSSFWAQTIPEQTSGPRFWRFWRNLESPKAFISSDIHGT